MDDLAKAQRQLEQAKARVQKLKARARTESRKRDTRRKIVLGGILISEARRDPILAAKIATWISQTAPRDRSLFDGWSLEQENADG